MFKYYENFGVFNYWSQDAPISAPDTDTNWNCLYFYMDTKLVPKYLQSGETRCFDKCFEPISVPGMNMNPTSHVFHGYTLKRTFFG